MKKALLIAAAFAVAAAFAAFDFGAARAIPVVNPGTTVNSGATNSTVLALGGLKGIPEVFVAANGNASRTALNVTLWATNAIEGGWTAYAASTFPTNAGVYRLAFPGEYLPKDAKLTIGSIGAASSVSAFILTY